jgi:hypothetical protein
MAEEHEQPVLHLPVSGQLDPAWGIYRRLAVGAEAAEYWREADAWIVVHDVDPPLLIEIRDSDGITAFTDAILWSMWIFIGIGTEVYAICALDGRLTTLPLGQTGYSYFAHFYPYDDFLLVASGVALLRFDRAARLVWQSPRLAVDGVLVERIEDGVIYGQGEQDPPDGWTPFMISLDTGDYLTSPA